MIRRRSFALATNCFLRDMFLSSAPAFVCPSLPLFIPSFFSPTPTLSVLESPVDSRRERKRSEVTRCVPPCWTTVVTHRICSAHNYEGAAARWHVHLFQNHRYATFMSRESVFFAYIHSDAPVPATSGDRKCRDRPCTAPIMATGYRFLLRQYS